MGIVFWDVPSRRASRYSRPVTRANNTISELLLTSSSTDTLRIVLRRTGHIANGELPLRESICASRMPFVRCNVGHSHTSPSLRNHTVYAL